MKGVSLVVGIAIQVLLAASALADDPQAPSTESQLPELDLSLAPDPGINPQILGSASPQSKYAWPATRRFGLCTSTVIGPNVILTAAHCITGTTAAYNGNFNGTKLKIECERPTEYKPGVAGEDTMDIALCLTSGTVPTLDDTAGDSLPYERIDLAADVSPGATLQLQGFGCRVLGGQMVDKLYAGKVTVIADDMTGRPYAKTDGGIEGIALCKGDSGGPAVQWKDSRRAVVGVNVEGNILRYAWVVRLGDSRISQFIQCWMKKAKNSAAKICGLNISQSGLCHV